MQRKNIQILLLCAISMSVVLIVLYSTSSLNNELYRANFTRHFVSPPFKKTNSLNLPYNSFYLAGASLNHVYLGNWTNPFYMIICNTVTLDTQHVLLQIQEKENLRKLERFRLKVDSPYFYLLNGNLPGIFRGRIEEGEATQWIPESGYFVDAVPINQKSFALRSYSSKSKAFELAKEKIEKPYFQFKYGLLEKQIDGLFCVDGMLHSNKEGGKLVYLYSYRNQYIVMDTSLNLLYRANTIDTISRAVLKVAKIKSTKSQMLASPPSIINSKSYVFQNYLFVKSNLLAKNEAKDEFLNNAVFDVYDLDRANYTFSFHIPNYQKEKLSDFIVERTQLVTLHGKYLQIYGRVQNSDVKMVRSQ